MKTKFTDAHKFARPYAGVDETNNPGYLAAKFAKIKRELRDKAEAERVAAEAVSVEQLIKVRALKGTK